VRYLSSPWGVYTQSSRGPSEKKFSKFITVSIGQNVIRNWSRYSRLLSWAKFRFPFWISDPSIFAHQEKCEESSRGPSEKKFSKFITVSIGQNVIRNPELETALSSPTGHATPDYSAGPNSDFHFGFLTPRFLRIRKNVSVA
jgi:hypothetical protein